MKDSVELQNCMTMKSSVWLLADPFIALASRIALIKRARHSIRLQTFIWGEDDLAFYFIEELVKAAERGVRVEILVDGWVGVDYPRLIRNFMDLKNVIESRHFNPPTRVVCPSFVRLIRAASSNARRLNHRMHTKAFIVDGAWSIVGGRNYQDKYFALDPEFYFRDREVLLRGDVTHRIDSYFEDFWNHSFTKRTSELRFTYTPTEKKRSRLQGLYRVKVAADKPVTDVDQLPEAYLRWHRGFRLGEWLLENRFTIDNCWVIGDRPADLREGFSPSSKLLLDQLRNAERSVLLQTPYLVLSEKSIQALREVSHRLNTNDVCLITNSFAATDNILAHLLGLRDRRRLRVRSVVRVCEYLARPKVASRHQPPHARVCNHSKTMVLSERYVYIGSSNFDPRSQYYNSEIGVLVDSRAFAQRVVSDIEHDLQDGNFIRQVDEVIPRTRDVMAALLQSRESTFDLRVILRIVLYFLRFAIPSRLKQLF